MKQITKLVTALVLLATCTVEAYGQTDMTNKLSNPDFESGLTDWTQSGMKTQSNTAFSKKSGSVYVEKWTSRGSSVGDGSVQQTVRDLPCGRYRLTVAAQNIQEDSPSTAQTGAWIFAGEAQTAVTVTADYTVEAVVMDGSLTIGFKADDATGNWIAVDNFRLIRTDDAHDYVCSTLQQVADSARAVYGDGSGNDAQALDSVLLQAEKVLANSDAASSEEMVAQIHDVEAAIETYLVANASESQSLDLTSRITNPSFEDGFTGWTQSGMQAQSNTAFSKKSGSIYVEKWTSRGSSVGDGYVRQTVRNLPCGRYRLTAVAQNIQEDTPAATKTGAWIFGDYTRTAVGVSDTYSVNFIVITGDADIGFMAEGASGNWIAVDNFQLEYIGEETEMQTAELQQRISDAEGLVAERMNATVLEQLQKAIENAKNATDGQYAEAAVALRDAKTSAELSASAYATLQTAIEEAENVYDSGTDNGRETFLAAIDNAKAVYIDDNSKNDALAEQVAALETATFAYHIAGGTGTVPKVTTDPRYARGAIAAFGRMTVSGVASSQILEQGFCWSTEPNPDVFDNRTTNHLENNGAIYVMDMEPATVYYMRAYAITKSYAVGYGDVIKMSTLPMGNVTYTYDYGGDEAQNSRITSALEEATYYWTNYTSIRGFNVSCVYSPGTPTADCGYGGNMRMGTNMGQRCGTCMHEMNHGIGGGTITIWGGYNESPLRTSVNGDWAGEHANTVLNFWENRTDLIITAAYDGAHWGFRTSNGSYSDSNTWLNKYAFNGAHLEPGAWAGPSDWNGTQIVYIGNALINQAMCEDGLVPVNYWSGGFCLPSYDFEQDDDTKYYIKSESADRGLYDSYLFEDNANKLTRKTMAGGTVTENDSAAWYVTFDPETQYYTLRNAATGHLLTYSGGFKTTASASSDTKFHFMRGRTDIEYGESKTRGYWIIHPESSNTPSTMTAAASGNVTSTALDLYDTASEQRWVFIAENEVNEFEEGTLQNFSDELIAYINQVRKVEATPHVEDIEGADNTLDSILYSVETAASQANTAAQVQTLLSEARTAGVNFLSSVTPSDPQTPFDLTFMITNAAIDSKEGWTGQATFGESCCEYFQTTFDFYQTVTGLPRGTFKLMAQAFQRPGSYAAAYNAYTSGDNEVSAVIYAGSITNKVRHIAEGASKTRLHSDDVQVGSPTVYIPNTMASAAAYFKNGFYDNEVWVSTFRKNSSLKIGVKGTVTDDGYWTIFDNFRLYFYGKLKKDDVTPVETITAETTDEGPEGVYSINGTLIRRTNDLGGLPQGLYIVGGKKVLVR